MPHFGSSRPSNWTNQVSTQGPHLTRVGRQPWSVCKHLNDDSVFPGSWGRPRRVVGGWVDPRHPGAPYLCARGTDTPQGLS